MVEFKQADSPLELKQILQLQKENLPVHISLEEAKAQGFVTVQHNLALLTAMNEKHGHAIAKHDDKVVGYALVMLPEMGDKIPALFSLFERIDKLNYKGEDVSKLNYFVMGQVCVAKQWRGKGVFSGLYHTLQENLSAHFDLIVTEIATRNTRSMRAHEKLGFEVAEIFKDETEEWAIVIWDWR